MSCESGSCKDCATIQGAIAYFKGRRDGDWNDPCQGALNTYLGMAIDALEKQAEPENKPLTLEQLRKMGGEPVWIALLNIAKQPTCEVITKICEDGIHTMGTEGSGYASFGLYDKAWIAYARKPEK